MLFAQPVAHQFVEYQVCESCGFRLMRVEPAYGRLHPVTTRHCAICGQTADEHGTRPGAVLDTTGRRAAWLRWLEEIKLTNDYVERYYHLKYEDFFKDAH